MWLAQGHTLRLELGLFVSDAHNLSILPIGSRCGWSIPLARAFGFLLLLGPSFFIFETLEALKQMATLDFSFSYQVDIQVFSLWIKRSMVKLYIKELLVGLGETHSCLKGPVFLVPNPQSQTSPRAVAEAWWRKPMGKPDILSKSLKDNLLVKKA